MTSEYELSEVELEHGWNALRTAIDRRHQSVESPTVVFLGAQPAAGKSHAQREVRRWYGRPMFAVDSDALRSHHPRFDEIIAMDPQRMPILTNQAASWWTRRSIEYARDSRIDSIIENTFHDPDVILESSAAFRQAGFRRHAVVIAVPEQISRLTVAARYLAALDRGDTARWTSLVAHDRAVSGAVVTVRRLHEGGASERITVMDRDGRRHFDAAIGTPEWEKRDPAEVLVAARHAPWTADMRRAYSAQYLYVATAALRTDSITSTTASLLSAISDDARSVGIDHSEGAAEMREFRSRLDDTPPD